LILFFEGALADFELGLTSSSSQTATSSSVHSGDVNNFNNRTNNNNNNNNNNASVAVTSSNAVEKGTESINASQYDADKLVEEFEKVENSVHR
jgi:hypothetical protein